MALVSIAVTLAVLERDGTTRGFVACDDVTWTFGKGIDTPDLSATVSTSEDDLAADPDLFDDAVVQVLFDAAGVGAPFLVETDDLTLIGGDEEAAAQQVTITAKSALFIASEWQVTPGEGVWLRTSSDLIYLGWTHPDYDDTGWYAPTRRTRASLTSSDAKHSHPKGWECQDADWLRVDEVGVTGGLTLVRPAAPITVTVAQQWRFAITADEACELYLYAPGYGGRLIEETKQETGFTQFRWFDVVLEPGDYFPTFAFTAVNSTGGDGFDEISYYAGPVLISNYVSSFELHSGQTGIKMWKQPKNDPRPGFTVGKLMHLLRDWNQAWMTDLTASCHTVTFSFTETLDSNGDAFTAVYEQAWRPGKPITEVMADLSDKVDFDVHLDPVDGHVVIDCYNRKGSDVSATVALVKGSATADGNILVYRARRRRRTATRASIGTEDGYSTRIDAALEATVSPRSTYLETQQSASIGQGRDLASAVIAEDGRREAFECAFAADDAAMPGTDFDWGDDVSALNRVGAAADKTVVKWGGERRGDEEPIFTAELR